ncbi:MAG: caspase family protein [Persicimonas sp.]
MTRLIATTFVGAVFGFSLSFGLAPAAAQAETNEQKNKQVYALIVANNSSVDAGVKPLRFADDDGARYFEMFDSLADHTRLLTTLDADSQKIFPDVVSHTEPPTRSRLKQAVAELAESIEADRQEGLESEVYLVFTGHGNVDDQGQGYLSLDDGKLHRKELFRDVIGALEADYTHLIVDACHSYFMVESRGGDSWEDDGSGDTLDGDLDAYLSKREDTRVVRGSTVGVIVSTSGTAEVHEWSRFRAGVFSHQLRSALLGAADVDASGDITYAELEAYLVAANAGVANPRARINVYADPPEQDRRRPLVALDDYENATSLEIPRNSGGRFHLEDARGLRYADFHADSTLDSRMILLHGPTGRRGYYLSSDDEQASVPVDEAQVSATELAFAAHDDQSRGSVDEAFRTGLFSVPYGDGFYRGFVAARDKYSVGATQGHSIAPQSATWSFAPHAAYGFGSDFFNTGGQQHHVSADATFRHDGGFGVGPFFSYGLSPDSLDASTVHRMATGVELSWQFGLTHDTYLQPRARAGHQVVFFGGTSGPNGTKGDSLGFRGEGALALGWDAHEAFSMQLEGGVSSDVFTHHDAEKLDERWYFSPYVGVGLGF